MRACVCLVFDAMRARAHEDGRFTAICSTVTTITPPQIRKQFHVVSDGHDQFDMQLEEMVSTMIEYGQDPTEVRRIYIPSERSRVRNKSTDTVKTGVSSYGRRLSYGLAIIAHDHLLFSTHHHIGYCVILLCDIAPNLPL